jgi:hypothetical protein
LPGFFAPAHSQPCHGNKVSQSIVDKKICAKPMQQQQRSIKNMVGVVAAALPCACIVTNARYA